MKKKKVRQRTSVTMPPGRKGVARDILFLILSGIFVIFGLYLSGTCLKNSWDYQAMKTWPTVTAKVRSATPHYHYSGGGRGGGGFLYYTIDARYEYVFQGRDYSGTRTHLKINSTRTYLSREEAEAECRRMMSQPLACYVNPFHPAGAILFRDATWATFVFDSWAGAFLLFLGSLGWFCILGYSPPLSAMVLRLLRQPWAFPLWSWLLDLRRARWASGRIRSRPGVPFWIWSVLALFWNVLFLIPCLLAPHDVFSPANGNSPWFMRIYALIGLVLIGFAVRQGRNWWLFKDAVFRMIDPPGVIGGKLAGVIELPGQRLPTANTWLILHCWRGAVVVWRDHQVIRSRKCLAGPNDLVIPVKFTIPEDRLPADEPWVSWTLTLKGCLSKSARAVFSVPVFAVREHDADFLMKSPKES